MLSQLGGGLTWSQNAQTLDETVRSKRRILTIDQVHRKGRAETEYHNVDRTQGVVARDKSLGPVTLRFQLE